MQTGARREAEATLSSPTRVLVVATDELAGPELIEEFRQRLKPPPAVEVKVIAPAVEKTVFRHALGDVDTATMEAGQRLETSLDELRRAGIPAQGEIGDSDPIIAAEDALRLFAADEVLIVAHADHQARWFEDGLFERAQQELVPAVRMLSVWHEEGEPPHLSGVAESGPGRKPAPRVEHELRLSANLPRLSRGDLWGAVIAIVGTIVAIVLAATGPGADSPGGAAQILIAMAVAVINMAHVVGLVLLESVEYRGGWQRFFRDLSALATPLAVIANGLISLLH